MNEQDYWNERYKNSDTGWDIGYPAPPITEYCNQLENKELKILIPGAGNSYEAEYLFKQGFKNVFVLDISEKAIKSFRERVNSFPEECIIQSDFFAFKGQFDLIIEQTFFCAIQPYQRSAYMSKMSELLKPGAKLVGLFFKFPLTEKGPPFGGSLDEYKMHLSKELDLIKMEDCYNSIEPRSGNEYFFIARKG